MGAKGHWAPWASLIAKGKNTNLTPYSGNSLNKNLLSQSARNLARLTALSFSRERFMTYLPILVGFLLGEAVRPLKWLKSLSSTSRSSLERLISKGFSSPNTGRRRLLTTSSKVMVSSPIEKKNVWREGHQRHAKCLNPDMLQMTDEFAIRKLPIHLNGPTGNLARNKIKENGNRFMRSLSNLLI